MNQNLYWRKDRMQWKQGNNFIFLFNLYNENKDIIKTVKIKQKDCTFELFEQIKNFTKYSEINNIDLTKI